MAGIWQWELEFIQNLQQIQSPALNGVFIFFSYLGNELFYLILFLFLLWCINFKLGMRVGILLLVSVYINILLKSIFQMVRPFDFLPALQLISAEGFGFPSGHAQSSILVWCSVAHWSKRRILWYLAFLLSFLIGFSRIYLGVHFPHDVMGGWLVGGFIFYLYHYLLIPHLRSRQLREKSIPDTQDFKKKIILVSLFPILVIIFPAVDIIKIIGILTGVGWGLVINSYFIHVQETGGTLAQRLLRFVLGISGIIILYFGLKILFPEEGQNLYQLWQFIRYVLLGLWIAAGAPWLFSRLKLAGGLYN